MLNFKNSILEACVPDRASKCESMHQRDMLNLRRRTARLRVIFASYSQVGSLSASDPLQLLFFFIPRNVFCVSYSLHELARGKNNKNI